MSALWQGRNGRTIMASLLGLSLAVLAIVLLAKPDSGVAEVAVTPPPNQEYIGTKKCAACHFPQFRIWRTDEHSKAFEILPAKYQEDAACLKCHTTGFGTPTGYKDASTKSLASISCEACHGPGSEHAKIALRTVEEEEITPELEQIVRDSIYKVQPGNICISCHEAKRHKAHLDYDKE